ncbi:MAG: enoyl-CoA hydratase-related protein [Bacteroidia bacterium]|nr:enoyl-CoA hydratase-related protein [Bacteroidia bacterium]
MPALLFEIKDSIATITLNRPDAFNSLNEEMGRAFIQALNTCTTDDSIRVIVITGSGKAFCAGQDLKEVTNPETHPGFEKLLKDRYHPIIDKIRKTEKPFIAAVNGVAAGAGANIALACDLTLASEKASFIQAFSAIGLIPDSGGTFFLPRILGLQKATALAMLGDKVKASEAESLGMIYKSVPVENFEEEVINLANRLATMPTKGLGLTKKAFNASLGNDFDAQMTLETRLQIEASETEDYAEGVAAFVEKRKPQFKGK